MNKCGNTRCSKLKFQATFLSSLQKPRHSTYVAPPWLKVGRMLSGLRVGSEGSDTRREIARWEANAASISISSGTRIGIALHGTVADFGSEAAARAEIE